MKSADSHGMFENCIDFTQVPGFPEPYRGKVRDVYSINDDKLAIVVTDRISAFDHILRGSIPFKGQILNRLAAFFMEQVSDIIKTHLIDVPHPNVTIAHACKPLPIEVVVRGYLAGHALREYEKGKRSLCGVSLPDGLRPNEAFPEPVITPTTKAKNGHDEDISRDQIISQKLLSEERLSEIEKTALKLFKRGTEIARKRGLILVDTKYEFGILNDELILIDEIHTPDSSRYFLKDGYEENFKSGKKPDQLSKEFVREWLISRNFMGRKDDVMPGLSETFRVDIYHQYAKLYNKLTGHDFTPVYTPDFEGTLKEILTRFSKKS